MVSEDLLVTRRGQMIETGGRRELVALHIDTALLRLHSTHPIWAMVEQPKLVSELTAGLMLEFDVDAATCESQLKELLNELAADGLVEIRPA